MIRPPSKYQTDRLLLRAPKMTDVDAIFNEYSKDIDVARYMTWVPHGDADSVAEFLSSLIDRGSEGAEYSWVILEQGENDLFGMINARVYGHIANMGYVLAKRKWQQGYMTEALSTVSDWMLAQPEIFRVSAECDIENVGSARVLEKCGFVCEGLARRWLIHPNLSGDPRDCYIYARVR